jgi:hypothetical protein
VITEERNLEKLYFLSGYIRFFRDVFSMSDNIIETQAVVPLEEMFPEAKLTLRDRLPMNFILTNALITIQKSILNIQYSSEEIKEAVQGFVAMIPDDLKDDGFNEEIEKAKSYIIEDLRPAFCGMPASDEYCKRKGIVTVRYIETFDYFKVLHACFNLLMRKEMLLKTQPKEIMTGKKAKRGARNIEPEVSPDEF